MYWAGYHLVGLAAWADLFAAGIWDDVVRSLLLRFAQGRDDISLGELDVASFDCGHEREIYSYKKGDVQRGDKRGDR